jgi:hypothetical protein
MIIGLCGKKLAGKDTAAQYLVDNYGYTRVSFAEKLKESVAALFDIPREWIDEWKDDQGGTLPRVEVIIDIAGEIRNHPYLKKHSQYSFSWREFLQRYGTESHREVFGNDFWVDQILPYYNRADVYKGQKLVISDVRFENEAARIKQYEGKLIEIRRPAHEDEAAKDRHVSEQMPFTPDYQLINLEDDKVNLYAALDEWMEHGGEG